MSGAIGHIFTCLHRSNESNDAPTGQFTARSLARRARAQAAIGIVMLYVLTWAAPAAAQQTQPANAASPTPAASDAPKDPRLKRLTERLNRVLTADNAPRMEVNGIDARLRSIADGARRIAHLAPTSAAQLTARRLELRAVFGRLRLALRRQRASTVSFRLARLRTAIEATTAIDHADTNSVVDYWRTVAHLIDARRNAGDVDRDRARLMRDMTREAEHALEYLRANPHSATRRLHLASVWGALRLWDQHGRSERVAQTIGARRRVTEWLAAHVGDRPAWRQMRAMRDRLGRRLSLTVPSSDGPWALQTQRGRRVVIVCHGRRVPSGWRAAMNAADRVLEVVVADAKPIEGDWPRVTDPQAAGRLFAVLGVETLPRVIVIDAAGRYARAGVAASVIEAASEASREAAESPATQPAARPAAQPDSQPATAPASR